MSEAFGTEINGQVAQPFYTSKTFWALFVLIVSQVLQYFGQSPIDDKAGNAIIDGILAALALIGRRGATQPLAVKGGVKL